jgi:transcriptional regulator with XRE-family HTH domain
MNKTEAEEIEAIEEALRQRGGTVSHFVKEAGVSRSTWARIKSGEVVPNGKTMRLIRQTAHDALDMYPELKKED